MCGSCGEGVAVVEEAQEQARWGHLVSRSTKPMITAAMEVGGGQNSVDGG